MARERSKHAPELERPMPMNMDAERAILGGILLNNACYYQAALSVRQDDFFMDSHRRIYRAILDLDADAKPIDLITVLEQLGTRGEIENVGGAAYVSSLTDGLPQRPSIETYCATVAENARRRQLIFAAHQAIANALDPGEKIEDTLAVAQNSLLDIATGSQKVRAVKVDEYIHEMFARMREQAQQSKSGMLGLTFGYDELDEATSGVMPGETVVIAGYSGDGKSLLCQQMVLANLLCGVPCLVFTQEMTKEQYLRRMVPAVTDGMLPGHRLRDLRGLPKEDHFLLDEAEKKLAGLPLWTVDASSVDVTELAAISRSLIRKEKIQLIVDDFLQLLLARGTESTPDRVSKGSGVLRQIAKDEGVVTVPVSQLTPSSLDKSKKPPPTIFMMRQSGDIAQAAHIIVFVYRPENSAGYFTDKDQIRIGKMREGSGRQPFPVELDRARLKFVKREEEKKADKNKPDAEKKAEAEKKTATAEQRKLGEQEEDF